MPRTLHLVCYDIGNPRRLRAALKLSRSLASGGQQSVHECWLDASEYEHLLQSLASLVREDEDRVMFVRLDASRSCHARGRGVVPSDANYLLVN